MNVCPACRKSKTITEDFEIFYWAENRLQFLRCQSCGLCFAFPLLSTELISRGNQALSKYYQQNQTREQEQRDARKAYLRGKVLARRVKKYQPRGSLLELGCYQGFVAYGFAQNSSWNVEGLEIAPDLARFVRDRLGIPCHTGTLQEAKLPSDSYDVILCHDLIEHINETEVFLAEIFRILKPGGRIEIITPNALQDLAFARRASASGHPITMLLNHIMMFSPRALNSALTRCGLKVDRIYSYDIRNTPKDLGWFGMNPPRDIQRGPSLEKALVLPQKNAMDWTESELSQLRSHPKVSDLYGFVRHILPEALRIKVPVSVGWGHEIYAIASKPL